MTFYFYFSRDKSELTFCVFHLLSVKEKMLYKHFQIEIKYKHNDIFFLKNGLLIFLLQSHMNFSNDKSTNYHYLLFGLH